MNASTIFGKAGVLLRRSAERRGARRLFSTHGPTGSSKHHIRTVTDPCGILTVVQL
jgi:hypothetical protein